MERPYEYYKEYYCDVATTKQFREQEKKALDIIERFINLGVKHYCSISAGKDSTVMMHLCWRVNSLMKFASHKDDTDFPGVLEYLLRQKEKYCLDLDLVSPDFNVMDIVKEHDFLNDVHSKGNKLADLYFFDVLKKYQKENEIKGVFIGLRAEESKGRLSNFKVNKHIYYNHDWNNLVCQPLATWQTKHIFAYLFSNNIEILPIYFQTKFVDSIEEMRFDCILPSEFSALGQVSWMKHYYPAQYRKLCEINPLTRSYT